MKSSELKQWATEAGAIACGVAEAGRVAQEDIDAYRRWVAAGHNGTMDYLVRYDRQRADPCELLDGARTVVSCAFPYRLLMDSPIASYAMGDDYHEVIRRRLGHVAEKIKTEMGGETRVCVDTAPILERYWAVRAGVGFVGRNHQLIVPGHGSAVLLGEILTTAEFEPDEPCALSCGDCMACVDRCPGGALSADGGFDARHCLSYLTIEYRGEFTPEVHLHGHLYGCDDCQLCCPHNRHPAAPLPEFEPRRAIRSLTAADVAAMDHPTYCDTFRHTAIRRAKLPQLHRNVSK